MTHTPSFPVKHNSNSTSKNISMGTDKHRQSTDRIANKGLKQGELYET